jgi:hypothetical protein
LPRATATFFIGQKAPQDEKKATTWGCSAASPLCAFSAQLRHAAAPLERLIRVRPRTVISNLV